MAPETVDKLLADGLTADTIVKLSFLDIRSVGVTLGEAVKVKHAFAKARQEREEAAPRPRSPCNVERSRNSAQFRRCGHGSRSQTWLGQFRHGAARRAPSARTQRSQAEARSERFYAPGRNEIRLARNSGVLPGQVPSKLVAAGGSIVSQESNLPCLSVL